LPLLSVTAAQLAAPSVKLTLWLASATTGLTAASVKLAVTVVRVFAVPLLGLRLSV
jgi:hypothetical protein